MYYNSLVIVAKEGDLCLCGTVAANRPIVQSQMIDNMSEYGAVVE
jgi:hypothetical protein